MCTGILLYKMLKDYPIIYGGNRDTPSKTGEVPSLISEGVVAPSDHGVTWFGLHKSGVVGCLANWTQKDKNAKAISRGTLLLEGIKTGNCKGLENYIGGELDRCKLKNNPSNHFVVMGVDFNQIVKLGYNGAIEIENFSKPGLYVFTDRYGGRRDFCKRRMQDSEEILSGIDNDTSIDEVLDKMKQVCQGHGSLSQDRVSSICSHKGEHSTIASTIIAVNRDVTSSKILHLQGQPCENDYYDYSGLAEELKL